MFIRPFDGQDEKSESLIAGESRDEMHDIDILTNSFYDAAQYEHDISTKNSFVN